MRLVLVFALLAGAAFAETTDQRIAAYEKQLAANPRDMRVMAGLASTFLQKVRETTDFAYLERASSLVDRMRTLDARNYAALRLRIEVAMQYHAFPQVLALTAELLERDGSDAGVLGLRGDALMESGRVEEAGDVYMEMAQLAPGLASYNRIAYLKFVTGHADEALAWMQQAVLGGSPLAENAAWGWFEFGEMLFKTGHVVEAETAYRRALEMFPGHHRAAGGLGRLLAAKGDLANARRFLEQAQAAVPLPEYSHALSQLARRRGDAAEVKRQDALVDAVERLMKANGEKANRVLALAYADEKRHLERALEIARAEFEVRNDVYSFDALAWVLHRSGRAEEARAAMERALKLDTPEPLFHFHAGMIALAAGEKEKARAHLERALALNPNFDFVHAPEARQALIESSGMSTQQRLASDSSPSSAN